MKNASFCTIGFVSMIVGFLLVSAVLGVLSASAAPSSKEDPFLSVTQNWDKNLSGSSRFTVLTAFNDEAVRDNETGIVWERSPQPVTASWVSARSQCANKIVGGRKGWRLPSVTELASLIDLSVASPGPRLPSGNPFMNVQPDEYWSATTTADVSTAAWTVFFNSNGHVGGNGKLSLIYVWCVRGPVNSDTY